MSSAVQTALPPGKHWCLRDASTNDDPVLYDPTLAEADRQSCLVHKSPVKRTLKPKPPTMVDLLSLSTHLFHLLLRFLFILPILPLISSQKEFWIASQSFSRVFSRNKNTKRELILWPNHERAAVCAATWKKKKGLKYWAEQQSSCPSCSPVSAEQSQHQSRPSRFNLLDWPTCPFGLTVSSDLNLCFGE